MSHLVQSSTSLPVTDDVAAVEHLSKAYAQMTGELSQVIVGMQDVIEQVLIAIFCHGHCILEGVPGLAKTLLVSTIADVLRLGFKRIQFTPDLMPADITGTQVLEEDRATGKRDFQFVRGPLFANMILADEINRTPPKTQAALLEAMQEGHVTVGETTFALPDPFFVLATQNPIEQEGTYPLPEAQLDRFMFKIKVDYPDAEEEMQIMKQATTPRATKLSEVLSGEQIVALQQIILKVPAAEHVYAYARDLVRATRPKRPEAADFVNDWVAWGAGPRAGISLMLAGKVRAILKGRFHVTTDDVKAMALPVLRHRVLTTYSAEAAGKTADDIIAELLRIVPTSREPKLATT